MSIATELQNLNDNIKTAYTKITSLGGAAPANKNMVNLPAAIETVRQYDIHTQVRGSSPARFERATPTARTIDEPFVPTNVTEIESKALAYAYDDWRAYSGERRGVNLNSIKKIGLCGMIHFAGDGTDAYPGMFLSRGQIKDIGFANLEEVSSSGLMHAFAYQQVENISFPKLTTVGQQSFDHAFYESSASNVTASFPVLTTLGTGRSSVFPYAFSSPNGSGKGLTSVDFSALETLERNKNAFQYAFSGNTALADVDFTSLRSVSGAKAFDHAFYGCSSLTDTSCFSALEEILPTSETSGGEFMSCFLNSGLRTVSFPELTTITSTWDGAFNSAFRGCTSLTTASFPKLTSAPSYCFSNAFYDDAALVSFSAPLLSSAGSSSFSYAFYNCTSLTTVSLPALTTLASTSAFSRTFYGCTSLVDISFPALTTFPNDSNASFGYAFQGCTSLSSVSFPAVTSSSFGGWQSHFNNMLRGCTGVTVHFPAAIQSTIGSWSDVRNGFGGTNTTVLFDL